MADGMQLKSKSRVGKNLEVLIEQGYLIRQPNRYRGLELPHASLAAVPTSALRDELRRRNQDARP
jgi:SOS-response transcriptional repressor LexA